MQEAIYSNASDITNPGTSYLYVKGAVEVAGTEVVGAKVTQGLVCSYRSFQAATDFSVTLSDADIAITAIRPAEALNSEFVNGSAIIQNPWQGGTLVTDYATTSPEKFVRVYSEGSEAVGGWMTKESELMGTNGKMLSPTEIQSKFALPNAPTNIADVNIPAGFNMREGQAAGNSFGAGGGAQFQAIDRVTPEMISNPRKLPN